MLVQACRCAEPSRPGSYHQHIHLHQPAHARQTPVSSISTAEGSLPPEQQPCWHAQDCTHPGQSTMCVLMQNISHGRAVPPGCCYSSQHTRHKQDHNGPPSAEQWIVRYLCCILCTETHCAGCVLQLASVGSACSVCLLFWILHSAS